VCERVLCVRVLCVSVCVCARARVREREDGAVVCVRGFHGGGVVGGGKN